MSKQPSQVSIPQAIHFLTAEVGKLKADHRNKFADVEQKIGELTEAVHGSTPDLDAFVQTLRTMNTRCAEQTKRIEKLEAALQVSPPPKKSKSGTIKIEPIADEVSFS